MHPILFHLGPLKVHSYGVLLMLGFMAALAWTIREGARRGISSDEILDMALALLAAGLVGARAVFILVHPAEFTSPGQWLQIWEGGLSFHGSLIGGALAMLWISRRRGIPLVPLMDATAPGLALGYAIGRIGCFLNGCCYGAACSLPWAVRFVDPSVPGGLTPPSHPTQLYSSAAGLLIFGVLARLSLRQRYNGQLILAFLFLYSIGRFIVEFYREGATASVFLAGLTLAQVASIVIAVAAVAAMVVASSWQRRRTPALREAAEQIPG